jgi:hypothetical protein
LFSRYGFPFFFLLFLQTRKKKLRAAKENQLKTFTIGYFLSAKSVGRITDGLDHLPTS